MGRCQGRYCAAVVARMTTDEVGEFGLFAPRPPAKPVPIHALAVEQAEWSGHKDFVPPDMARPRETAPLPVRDGRHAGDRRRRRRLLPRLLAGARGHRDAGGRARRGEPAGLRRQCRQPACPAPGVRLCPGRTARQSRRRHAAAWAGLGGAVAGDPARHRPGPRDEGLRRPDAGARTSATSNSSRARSRSRKAAASRPS